MKRIHKAMLSTFIALCVLFPVGVAWNNFRPYAINDWQIDNTGEDWHITQLNIRNVQDLDDSAICNITKYQTALIQEAVSNGMSREVLTNAFTVANKEGPKGKLPVFLQTAKKDNQKVIIIVYKSSIGWAGRLAEIKPFIPISVKSNTLWTVMVQEDNDTVILSDGIM